MRYLALTLALFACSAQAQLGPALAGAFQGQQRQQCLNSCRPGDAQCYQACANLFPQRLMFQPVPQPTQQPVGLIDQACVRYYAAHGFQLQLAEARCTY